LLKLRRTMVEV